MPELLVDELIWNWKILHDEDILGERIPGKLDSLWLTIRKAKAEVKRFYKCA